jgi:antitoxin component YwqK of YwqJK toxin-antitoxin module
MRISDDDVDFDEDSVCLYQSEPFTGTLIEYGKEQNILTETDYVDGIANGRARIYHPDGTLKSQSFYEQGILVGTYQSWYPTGQPREAVDYVDGLPARRRSWTPDGREE